MRRLGIEFYKGQTEVDTRNVEGGMKMSHLPNMARVRYGEHQVAIGEVFAPLYHNPKLISDCAILSAGIYSREEKMSGAKTLP